MWCFVRTVCYYCFYFWKPFSYFFIHIIKSYTVMDIPCCYNRFEDKTVFVAGSMCLICKNSLIFLIFKREDFADMLGICATTVWRAIKQLKEVGLIEEKRQGLNRPNLIYIGKIDYSVAGRKRT